MVFIDGLPVSRACQVLRVGRVTYYRSLDNWAQRDAPVIEALSMLGAMKPHWGFWNYSATEYRTSVESQATVVRL